LSLLFLFLYCYVLFCLALFLSRFRFFSSYFFFSFIYLQTGPVHVSKGRSSPNLRPVKSANWHSNTTSEIVVVRTKNNNNSNPSPNASANSYLLSAHSASLVANSQLSGMDVSPHEGATEQRRKSEKRGSRGRDRPDKEGVEKEGKERSEKRLSRGGREKSDKQEREKERHEKRLSKGKDGRDKDAIEREKSEKHLSRGRDRPEREKGEENEKEREREAREPVEKRQSRDRGGKDREEKGGGAHVLLPLPPVTLVVGEGNLSNSSRLISPVGNAGNEAGAGDRRSVFSSPVLMAALNAGPQAKPSQQPALPQTSSTNSSSNSIPLSSPKSDSILINKDLESFADDSCDDGSEAGRVFRNEHMRRLSRAAEEAVGVAGREDEEVAEMSEIEPYSQQQQQQQHVSRTKLHSNSTGGPLRPLKDSIRSLLEQDAITPGNEPHSLVDETRPNRSTCESPLNPLASSGSDFGAAIAKLQSDGKEEDRAEERFFSASVTTAIHGDTLDKNHPVDEGNSASSMLHPRTASNPSMADLTDSLRSRSDSTSSYILRCEIPESISSLWSMLLIDDGTKLNGGHIDMSTHEDGAREPRPENERFASSEIVLSDALPFSHQTEHESRVLSLDHALSSPSSATSTLPITPDHHHSNNSPSPSPGSLLATADYMPKRKSPTHQRKADDILNLTRLESSGGSGATNASGNQIAAIVSGGGSLKINLSNVSSANTESHLYLPTITATSPKHADKPSSVSSSLVSSNAKEKEKDAARHKHKGKKERSRERDRDSKNAT
jgi:hypothetical protein